MIRIYNKKIQGKHILLENYNNNNLLENYKWKNPSQLLVWIHIHKMKMCHLSRMIIKKFKIHANHLNKI